MIVDAVPLIRFGLSSLIVGHPHFELCAQAGDAPAAREQCLAAKPDLVVLDLAVPRGGGLGLLGDLRRLHASARVLVMSPEEDAFLISRVFQAGAGAYVSKGDEPAEVLAGLESLVEGKRFASWRVRTALLDSLAESPSRSQSVGISALSDRELEIFQSLGEGHGATAIARQLGLSVRTVETHQKRIKEKLGLTCGEQLRARARAWAHRNRCDIDGPEGSAPKIDRAPAKSHTTKTTGF